MKNFYFNQPHQRKIRNSKIYIMHKNQNMCLILHILYVIYTYTYYYTFLNYYLRLFNHKTKLNNGLSKLFFILVI